MVGSSFNDTLVGFDNADNVLVGGGGNDSIQTILGDIARGGEGNDTLLGSSRKRRRQRGHAEGGGGNDFLRAFGGTDTVLGGAGNDTVVVGIDDEQRLR